jgi:hypothetical protein
VVFSGNGGPFEKATPEKEKPRRIAHRNIFTKQNRGLHFLSFISLRLYSISRIRN